MSCAARRRRLPTVMLLAVLACLVLPWPGSSDAAPADQADPVLKEAGVKGGLAVHLGCGDEALAEALHQRGGLVVQALDTDAETVKKARARLQESGVYGPVSVARFDGKHLPYIDNLVNLLVAEDLGDVAREEALRVLAPGGVLCVKQGEAWQTTVKPRPGNIDEWTHYLHDASGNAVADDDLVGPPARLQWSDGPAHTRSHEHIPSIYALVSTAGRIFYIIDEAPIESIVQTPRWTLVCRDAFNGLLLWKRPLEDWFPHIVNWGQTPRHLQRKLVAVGDRVYVTLGLLAPLSVLDAATGEVLDTFQQTEGTEEIVLHDGVLLLVVRGVTEGQQGELKKWRGLVRTKGSPAFTRDTAEPLVKRLRQSQTQGKKSILALDAASGDVLWKKDGPTVAGVQTDSLSAVGDRVLYQVGGNVVCVDLNSGDEQWKVPAPGLRTACRDRVFCADGKKIVALSAETGKTLWSQPSPMCQIRDAFVAGGSLWIGGFKPFQGRSSGKRGPSWGPYFASQFDLDTGKPGIQVEPKNPGHHHRCYANKATQNYIMAGRRGTEFIDLKTGEVLWNSWARGVCRYGVMPCNGLLYVPPHACACYMSAKLTGFNALAARPSEGPSRGGQAAPGTQDHLERGPAYAKVAVSERQPPADSWPTYRHDPERSAYTPSPVPAKLKQRWLREAGSAMTAPTVAGGLVYVAEPDKHQVRAIDADSGKLAWRFTAGSRVDTPPTIAAGRAIFGCRDGSVYCLDAQDGALAWRLKTPRADRLAVVNGQLESVAPIHGSVLVLDGTVYFTAGRSSYLDGGIDLYRVDLKTGEVLARTPIYSPDPKTGRQPAQTAPSRVAGARSEILAADGDYVYLRDSVFDRQGKPCKKGNPHLLTMTDYLDDSWSHRSYWIFGTDWSVSCGCAGRDRRLLYGRLLAFDDTTVYGYGRASVHWSNQLEDGAYRLFARKRGEDEDLWSKSYPVQVRAMVVAGPVIFVAGVPAEEHALPGMERSDEAVLLAVSAADGKELARRPLPAAPVFDGVAAAGARLYLALRDGPVLCLEGE